MKRNKNGFTLVECIVAIGIVTVISTAAIFIYQTAAGSVSDRWEYYQAINGANNAVAIFKSAENSDLFAADAKKILNFSNKLATDNTEDVTIGAIDSFTEYDLSSKMQTAPLSSIVVYPSETTENVELKSGTNTVKLSYANEDAIKSDLSYDSTGTGGTLQADSKKGGFTYTVNKTEGTNASMVVSNLVEYSNGSLFSNVVMTMTADKITYDDKTSANKDTTSTTNTFEKYLIKKGYLLKPCDGASLGSNVKNQWVEVWQYDATSKTFKKKNNPSNSSQYMYLYLEGNKFFKSSLRTQYYNSDTYKTTLITNISYVYATDLTTAKKATKADFTDDDGNTFKNFTWAYYPYLAVTTSAASKGSNVTATYTAATNGTVNNITFTPSDTMTVSYALTKDTETEHWVTLYNAENAALYTYTAASSSALATAVASIREAFGYNSDYDLKVYLYDDSGNVLKDSSNNAIFTTKLRNMSGTFTASKVKITDNSTTGEIAFCDASDTEIVCFTYKHYAMFEQDKAAIESGGEYASYYNGTALVTPGTINVQYKNETGRYTVIMGEDDHVVFSSGALQFDLSNQTIDADAESDFLDISSSVSCGAVKNAYQVSYGAYSCFIVTTFSEVTFDTSVEPQIKVWVMKTKKMPSATQIAKLSVEDEEQAESNWLSLESSLGTPYISYKKG